VGADLRRERMTFKANSQFAALVVASTGVDPHTDSEGTRNVYGAYAELNLPITKQLEVTGAIRADKYSDVGSTVNPKLSFRFQPSTTLLFRGSASTGFRAPSLYDLHAPLIYTNTPNNWDDPLAKCDASGNPTVGGFAPTACGQQFMGASDGNPNLKPEKSKNLTIGFVFEPVKDLTVGVDLWSIKLTNAIGYLPDTTIFGDPVKYASLFHRNAEGQLSFDGSQCPGTDCGYVLQQQNNLGGVNTRGLDLSLAYRLRTAETGTFNFALNGTYVDSYKYQTQPDSAWIQNVGLYSGNGPIFRWQQTANVRWTFGAYGLGLTNRYKSGYTDQNDPTATDLVNHHVGAYSLWDIDGSWAVTKSITVVGGVRNLLDTTPPLSNQGATFQVGFDPRFTDPTGRAYYLRGTFSF
jgi:iron complex outermembrane receptor protein